MSQRAPSPRLHAASPRESGGIVAPRRQGSFGRFRAQRWVLASAVITALIYAFRKAVEPAGAQTTPAKKHSGLATLAGAGQPPSLEQWAVSYGVAFTMLAMLALALPEIAATIAAMMVAGNLLTNGMAIASDIGNLQGTSGKAASFSGTPQQQANEIGRAAGITGPISTITPGGFPHAATTTGTPALPGSTVPGHVQ